MSDDDLLDEEGNEMGHIERLARSDLAKAAALMGRKQARYLVGMYYNQQDVRKIADSQAEADKLAKEPNVCVSWLAESTAATEITIQKALGIFARQYTVGRWLQSIVGIGPVISAGLLAHFDIRRARFAGSYWSFAGLNPDRKWIGKEGATSVMGQVVGPRGKAEPHHLREIVQQIKGSAALEQRLLQCETRAEQTSELARRPWSDSLHVLMWKVGESFVKLKNNDKAYYAQLFFEHKAAEWKRNLSGANTEECQRILTEKDFSRETVSKRWYKGEFRPDVVVEWLAKEDRGLSPPSEKGVAGVPMLPPAHVHARARRATVKFLLSHLFDVSWMDYYGTPAPEPYAFSKLGHEHKHLLVPPNWPMKQPKKPWKSLKDLLDGDGPDQPKAATSSPPE